MRTPQSHTARENLPSRSALEDLPMPRQVKIAAAWTSFMFLYIYVDYLALYQPGVIDTILAGLVWEFQISQTLLTVFLALMAVPILMIVLSVILPARANRVINLAVASVYISVQRGGRVVDLLLRPVHRARGAHSGLHLALCLDLAPPHHLVSDHGNQPRP